MQALFSVFLDILYAINKKSIKKEDARPRRSDYLVNKGSKTSSTISISDMLEIVKENSDNIKLVTSVLSKDVCEKLGIERPKSVFNEDVIYSFSDEDEAYGVIAVDMNDGERYEVLKDKKIQTQEIEIDNDFDIDFDFLENNIKSIVEKPLKEKLRQMGIIGRKYKLSDIDLEFEFTGKGLNKSLNSQTMDYGGNFGDFAKVALNIQKLFDNSVLLDIHSDKAKGTTRENPQLARTYVLFSAFRDGEYIKPVQFEVKQYVDNNNRLYVAVALTKIETGVMGNTILDNNQASTYLLPVSNISISEIFKNVNPKDRKFLKYIPNQFLSDEQIKAKRLALREDDIKYGRVKDGKYSFGDEDEQYLQAVQNEFNTK